MLRDSTLLGTLRISTRALQHLSAARPRWSTLRRRGISPARNRGGHMKTCTEYNGPSEVRRGRLYRSGHCWPTCSLEQTRLIDLGGNTWERRRGPPRRIFSFRLLALTVPFSSNLVFPRRPSYSPPNYGDDL